MNCLGGDHSRLGEGWTVDDGLNFGHTAGEKVKPHFVSSTSQKYKGCVYVYLCICM